MAQFTVVKNGYDKKEVELYVDKLKAQLDIEKNKNQQLSQQLKDYQDKDNEIKSKSENVSIALTAAV